MDLTGRKAFRGVVYALGAVATGAGLHTVLLGGRSIPGGGVSDPRIESELRFYAAFYVAYGLAALRVAPRADREEDAVRALGGAMLLAGLARAAAWRDAGRPSDAQLTLLAIELAGPPALVAWQARLP
jgi:hypothetical protein